MLLMKRLKVITLGCSKNSVDTEHLLAALPADAFRIVDDAPFDYLLYNTCGFIGDAKQESIQAILETRRVRLPLAEICIRNAVSYS